LFLEGGIQMIISQVFNDNLNQFVYYIHVGSMLIH
jgi:hypothetical protein